MISKINIDSDENRKKGIKMRYTQCHLNIISILYIFNVFMLDITGNMFSNKVILTNIDQSEVNNVANLLRIYLQEIDKGLFFNEQNFNENLRMLEFMKIIVENSDINDILSMESVLDEEIHKNTINEEILVEGSEMSNSIIADEKSKFKNSVEYQKINKYFKEVIEVVFGPEEPLKHKKEENGPIYDFQCHKTNYIIKFFDERAKLVFDEFCMLHLAGKASIDIKAVLFKIYFDKNDEYQSKEEFEYILHKIICFLITKFGSMENTDCNKSILLDFIIDLSRKINIKSCFIPEKKIIISSTTSSKSKDTCTCLLNHENDKKLKNLQFVIVKKIIIEFSVHLKTIISSADSFFEENEKHLESIRTDKYFYKIYVLLSVILELTKNVIEMSKVQENAFGDDNLGIRKLTIYVTKSITLTYRSFLFYYIDSLSKIQNFENENENFYEISKEFTWLYIRFIHHSVLFNALDCLLTSSFRNLCLDSNSHLMDMFFLVVSNDITHIENLSHTDRKVKFKKDQQDFIDEIVQDKQIEFNELCTKIKFDEKKEQDYKHFIVFLLELITIRKDVQKIFDLNLISLKKNCPEYIQMQELKNVEYESIQRSFYDKKSEEEQFGITEKTIENNFIHRFETIKGLCDYDRYYSILYLSDWLAFLDVKLIKISQKFKIFNSDFFSILKISNKHDFDELFAIMLLEFNLFMSVQFEVLSFSFSNTYQLLIYESMIAKLGNILKNQTSGVNNTAHNDKKHQKTSLNDSTIKTQNTEIRNQKNEKLISDHFFVVWFCFEFFLKERESVISSMFPNKSEMEFLSERKPIFISVSWYMLYENLQYLFMIEKSEESIIKALQTVHPIIYITYCGYHRDKYLFLMVLISDIEINIEKFSNKNESSDGGKVIKNYLAINMSVNERPNILKEIKIHVIRNENSIFFDRLLLSISNIL